MVYFHICLFQLHFSHFKSFNDLPLNKCTLPACCGGMYHCRLCPVRQFVPTYRQHLIAHYVTHWKQRVAYKGNPLYTEQGMEITLFMLL